MNNHDIDILAMSLHGKGDCSPMQYISTDRLEYYRRLEAAVLASIAANRELSEVLRLRPTREATGQDLDDLPIDDLRKSKHAC